MEKDLIKTVSELVPYPEQLKNKLIYSEWSSTGELVLHHNKIYFILIVEKLESLI